MGEAIIGLFVFGLLVFASIGIVESIFPEYSYPKEWRMAEERCVRKDGVEKIEYDHFSIDVYCVDGARYVIDRKK